MAISKAFEERMIYIRYASTLGTDDAPTDSFMFPVSAFRGCTRTLATTATLYFEAPYQYVEQDTGGNSTAWMTIPSEAHVDFFEALAIEIATGDDDIIIVGDNVTSEYLGDATAVLITSNNVIDD